MPEKSDVGKGSPNSCLSEKIVQTLALVSLFRAIRRRRLQEALERSEKEWPEGWPPEDDDFDQELQKEFDEANGPMGREGSPFVVRKREKLRDEIEEEGPLLDEIYEAKEAEKRGERVPLLEKLRAKDGKKKERP